jgi:hypothetical protein
MSSDPSRVLMDNLALLAATKTSCCLGVTYLTPLIKAAAGRVAMRSKHSSKS